MRVIIQRVLEAAVRIDGVEHAKINQGLLVLVGFEHEDHLNDLEWMAKKILSLRIFNDNNGLMNLSLQEIGGSILIVSQFTLFAATKKGNRPSFIKAAKPEFSIPFYEKFIEIINSLSDKECQTGVFGADMKVDLINDGPVTIFIDSKMKE
jgi:D-tyrosyl-tRNA(Tyr) deacylase